MLALVAIGFLAGFATHRTVVASKIKRVAALKSAEGFEAQLMNRINLDEAQKMQVKPIIEKYADKISRASQEARQLRKMMVDSMHSEMKPFLNSEQIEQLDNFSRRFRTYKKGQSHLHMGKRDATGTTEQ